MLLGYNTAMSIFSIRAVGPTLIDWLVFLINSPEIATLFEPRELVCPATRAVGVAQAWLGSAHRETSTSLPT